MPWGARPRTSSSIHRGRSCSGSRSTSTTSRSGPRTWAARCCTGRSRPATTATSRRTWSPASSRWPGRRSPEPFAQGRLPVASAVAVPGIVGHDGGVVVAPNLHWEAVPLPGMLSGELGPLTVENEANLGALAELTEGAGRGLANFVYLSAEVGIGAGIVVGGELFRGAHGFGGEIGHLTIDSYGPPCPCGSRGCLERLAGQDALLRLAGWDARVRGPGRARSGPARCWPTPPGPVTPRRSRRSARWGIRWGSPRRRRSTCSTRRRCCSAATSRPSPNGCASRSRAELHRRLLAGDGSGCQVLEARLSGEAAVRGAAASARRRVLADPLGLRAGP